MAEKQQQIIELEQTLTLLGLLPGVTIKEIVEHINALQSYVISAAASEAELKTKEAQIREKDAQLHQSKKIIGELEVMLKDKETALEQLTTQIKDDANKGVEVTKRLEEVESQRTLAKETEKAVVNALVRISTVMKISLTESKYSIQQLKEMICTKHEEVMGEAAKQEEKYGAAHAALGEMYNATVEPLNDEALKKLSIEQLVNQMRRYVRWTGREVGSKLQSLYERVTERKPKVNITLDEFVEGIKDGFDKKSVQVQKYLNLSREQHVELAKLVQHTKGFRDLMLVGDISKKLPEKAGVYSERGMANFKADNYAEALNYFILAILKDPTDGWSIFNISKSLYKLGKAEDALRFIDEAEQKFTNPSNVSWVRSYKGTILENLGRHEEAIKAYQSALKLNPQNDEAKEGINRLQTS